MFLLKLYTYVCYLCINRFCVLLVTFRRKFLFKNIIIIIIITNSYTAHLTLNRINALYIYSPLVIGPINIPLIFLISHQGVYSPELPWRCESFSFTISTSTLAGTHLYSWVKRSIYSKVSCSRTQVSRPGFEPTFR